MRSLVVPVAVLLVAVAGALSAPRIAGAQEFTSYSDLGRWFRSLEDTVRYANLGALNGGRSTAPENSLMRHPEYSTYNTVMRRRMFRDRLQLQLESVGGVHPNPNVVPGYGRLRVASNTRASGIEATITPMAAEAPACRTTAESLVRAQVVAQLGRRTRDGGLFATLSLERSSFGGDQVRGTVWRCSGCTVAWEVDSVLFNRSWTLGNPHTLTIQYDRAAGRIAFTVAGGTMTEETRSLGGLAGTSDDFYPNTGFGLGVETVPANCPASGDAPAERLGVSMDARFEAVRWRAP